MDTPSETTTAPDAGSYTRGRIFDGSFKALFSSYALYESHSGYDPRWACADRCVCAGAATAQGGVRGRVHPAGRADCRGCGAGELRISRGWRNDDVSRGFA